MTREEAVEILKQYIREIGSKTCTLTSTVKEAIRVLKEAMEEWRREE